MAITLPRGAAAIARAGIILCDTIDRHPLVPATDPDTTRQALYAAVKAACAALRELVPDRFVDPGQSSTATVLEDSAGVDTPTRYRKNGGRLTIRMQEAGVVSFASVGLSPFNATTGAFTDTSGTYGTVADLYAAIINVMKQFYSANMNISLERVEQTVGGNLVVVTPAGSFPGVVGPGLVVENPLWIITTMTIRTAQAGRELKFKMPGAGVNLGKSTITPASGGTNMQQLAAVLVQTGGGAMAYNGLKASGVALLSTSDNKREYRRLTR